MPELVQLAAGNPHVFNGTPAPLAGPLIDTFGRTHTDLRVSVIDRCNIRCSYCMPETGATFLPQGSVLSFGEIIQVVKAGVKLGIEKVRVTGGEPLLRPRLATFIEKLAVLPGLRDLALTTNGILLGSAAQELYDAGLRRLNIHLDTLDRERFRQITRRDDLSRVLDGIDAALRAGYHSIKINAVAIRGWTEADLVPLAHFGRDRNIEIRYIEFMPLDGQQLWSKDRVFTAAEMITILSREFGPLLPVPDADPRAPATEYRFADGRGRVGFIASVSRPFCLNCNRLRLTSDGKLRNCLFARNETDLRPLLASSDADAGIESALRASVWQKWAGHQILTSGFAPPERPMYSIGG